MAKVSPVGRVSHPSVFELNEYKGKKSWQLTLIFDEDTDLTGLAQIAKDAARERFGDNYKDLDIQWPIKNGDEKKGQPAEYAGKMFAKFKSSENRRPQVVDGAKRQITKESGVFYPGCYARVSFSAYAWGDPKSDDELGVSFGLNNIQFVRDGEAFDGRTAAEDDFDALEDALSADADLF